MNSIMMENNWKIQGLGDDNGGMIMVNIDGIMFNDNGITGNCGIMMINPPSLLLNPPPSPPPPHPPPPLPLILKPWTSI